MIILGVFKISGHSMMPNLKPNDQVIVSGILYLFREPHVGDVVVFRYNNKVLIKRIVRIENREYYLRGDNKADNLKVKPIKRKEIIGRVIFRI